MNSIDCRIECVCKKKFKLVIVFYQQEAVIEKLDYDCGNIRQMRSHDDSSCYLLICMFLFTSID